MIKLLFTELMEKWGPSKLTKVLSLMLLGGSIGGLIGANTIPDNPSYMGSKNLEKENK